MEETEKAANETETDSKVQEGLDNTIEENKDEIKEIEVKIDDLDLKLVKKVVPDDTPVGRKTPHLTDQGFFDLKFYHNKLW